MQSAVLPITERCYNKTRHKVWHKAGLSVSCKQAQNRRPKLRLGNAGDNLSLRRAISYFLNNIAKQTKEQETIAAIGEDIFAVALDQPFRCLLDAVATCTTVTTVKP